MQRKTPNTPWYLRTHINCFYSSTALAHGKTQSLTLTSTILSHSRFPCTAVTVTYWAECPDRSMDSKPSVVPELVQVVTRSGAYTSSVLTLVAPLYIAGDWSQMCDKIVDGRGRCEGVFPLRTIPADSTSKPDGRERIIQRKHKEEHSPCRPRGREG